MLKHKYASIPTTYMYKLSKKKRKSKTEKSFKKIEKDPYEKLLEKYNIVL